MIPPRPPVQNKTLPLNRSGRKTSTDETSGWAKWVGVVEDMVGAWCVVVVLPVMVLKEDECGVDAGIR